MEGGPKHSLRDSGVLRFKSFVEGLRCVRVVIVLFILDKPEFIRRLDVKKGTVHIFICYVN